MKSFSGRLDGVTIYDLINKIDYNKSTYEERLEVIEDILNSTDFFVEYFDEYYNCHINEKQGMSEDEFVCVALERMASYLLLAEDIRDDISRKNNDYTFVNKKDFFQRKLEREPSFENLCKQEFMHTVNGHAQNSNKNYLLSKKQKIYSSDLKDDGEMGYILRQYEDFMELSRQQLHKKVDREGFLLQRNIGYAKEDMLFVKNSYKGTIDFIHVMPGGLTSITIDDVDFTNKEQVQILLCMQEMDLSYDDLSLIIFDFQKLLSKVWMDDFEKQVVELLRLGYKRSDIARELNCYHIKVTRAIEKITKKIVSKQNQ